MTAAIVKLESLDIEAVTLQINVFYNVSNMKTNWGQNVRFTPPFSLRVTASSPNLSSLAIEAIAPRLSGGVKHIFCSHLQLVFMFEISCEKKKKPIDCSLHIVKDC